NRTHLRDYAEAIGPATALLLKVHTSNYRVIGFTADVSSRELVELGRERGIQVMEDLGSGSLVDLRPWGFPYEPTVPEVVPSDAAARALDAALRIGDPPVVGRLVDDRLFLDCRTVLPTQVPVLVKAIVAAAQP